MFRLVLGNRRWQCQHIAGAAILGILGGLVKVTTLAPYFALGSCLAAWGLWNDHETGKFKLKIAAAVGLSSVALPVAATWQWTKFADRVKAENPIGIYLTSKALRAWNFGTFRERLHPRIYIQLLSAANNHLGSHQDGRGCSSSYSGCAAGGIGLRKLRGALRRNYPNLLQLARRP